jgi:DmsE family decaheme c-type cytochrome
MDRKNPTLTAPGHLLPVLGLVLCLVLPIGAIAQSPADYVGTETCLDCHDGMAADIAKTVHGKLADYQYPGLATGCEACHGPGATHAESEDPADIFSPTADMGNDGTDLCLDCHTTGPTLNWEFGIHAESDVSCLSCHKMHDNATRRALLADTEEKVCFTCHMDAQAQFQLPSHHPVREGFMTCSSCHDSHGNQFKEIADGETSRDACLVCHQQHAGPFVFEHSPVMEDCAICHDPHGAVANNLLRQNEPFICLQCHQPHFHTILDRAGTDPDGNYSSPPRTWDTDVEPNADPGYAGLSGVAPHDGMKRVMLTKCTQCHSSVHGTDLPSQGISGQGRALNR